jgi:methyltransferase (TIGR00027 family)
MATAYMRALTASDPRQEIRGGDDLAEIFLTDEQRNSLKDPVARAWVLQNRITPGAYEFMLARTSFFDQIVRDALLENVGQVVFLGAGYDSRPYRFGKLIQDTLLFEVDTGPTQDRKRDCLRAAQIPIPGQIRFVPLNFDTEDLADGLFKAGFSQRKSTLFVWEGVTYYLNADVVNSMLAFVRSAVPLGSSICFDYAALSVEALNENRAREIRKLLHSQYSNEPTRFGIPAGEIESFLASRGFAVVQHLTAAEMTGKYLSARDHLELGEVPPLFCLVHAKSK